MTLEELEMRLEPGEALFLEPRETFDAAIVGIAERVDGLYVIAYDVERVVQALMEAHNWDEDEAREWYEFNTAGAYAGPGTPVFITRLN
jgi:hypothetical protein